MPKANEVKNVTPTAEADLKKEETITKVKEEPKAATEKKPEPKAETKSEPKAEKKSAASKTTTAKASTTRKTTAKKTASARKAKESVCLQYAGRELEVADIVEKVKKACAGKTIKDIRVYLKPEENMAYYVVNGEDTGSVEM